MHSTAIGKVLPFTQQCARIMKLIALFLILSLLQVAAKSSAQVSLKENAASLEKVLLTIKSNSGFDLFFDRAILKAKARPVTITVSNVSVEEALKKVFKDQPELTYTLEGKIISVKEKIVAPVTQDLNPMLQPLPPPIDVRGRVVDSLGQPLMGAGVKVRGGRLGTTTDENGYFLLKGVEESAMLEISFTGYATKVVKAGDEKGLSGLVLKMATNVLATVTLLNTGYQQLKPNEVNGSYVVIDNKRLNEQVGTNILDRLKNIVPGLSFTNGKIYSGSQSKTKTNVVIRGLSTIEGVLDPLIVLDNFIYEGNLENINPNDVESVTILKDAAATSIWGARAGNGVIVITTKKGRFNQKLRIDFNTSLSITPKPDLLKIPYISTSDFINVEEFLFNNKFNLSDTSNTYRPALTPVYEILLKRKNGQITASDSANQIDALKKIDGRNEYNKFYRDAAVRQYALTLSGGSGNMAWLFAGAYDNTIGQLQSKSERVNVRIRNTYKPIKDLQISVNANYTNSTSSPSGAPGYNSIRSGFKFVPYLQFQDDSGNPLPVYNYRKTYIDTVGGGRLLDWKLYPIDNYKHVSQLTQLHELIAELGVQYNLFNGALFQFYYQNQKQWSNSEINYGIKSFYTRDLINRFTKLGATAATDTFRVPKGDILELSNNTVSSQNFRGQLSWSRNSDKHAVSAMIGAEAREVRSTSGSSTEYGFSRDPLRNGFVDYFTAFPNFTTGSLENIAGSPTVGNTSLNRFVSVYGNASYTYISRYSLSVSGRKDAANIFGLSTNDKWKPLWSVGAGWNISNESFYKFYAIPTLKLRATFGYSGNVDLSRTALPIASRNTNTTTNLPYLRIGTLNNPGLKWEQLSQINLAVDFAFNKDIVSGSLDFYTKRGVDLYGASPVDYTAWGRLNSLTKNVASMKGKGVELLLTTRNLNRALSWNTTFLYSYNTSETLDYFDQTDLTNVIAFRGKRITPVIGRPLFAIAAYKWAGLNASGEPQGYLDGQKSTDFDKITSSSNLNKGTGGGSFDYIGSADPTHYGSVTNSFTWKGFSLSFNISYSFGYFFRKNALSYYDLFTTGIGNKEFENRWLKPGDENRTHVPSMTYVNHPQFTSRSLFYELSEVNVLKGDNVRLEYINIGYYLNARGKKLPFEGMQLYLNISKPGILWRSNKENLDPDSQDFPVPSTFTFGVRTSL